MKELYTALNAAMQEVGYVQKAGTNSQQGYKYAGEADLLRALRPALVKHGLMLYPSEVREWRQVDFTTAKGSAMHRTDVRMAYTLAHISGESITIESLGCGMDSGDKDAAKALTIGYKYALRQALAIETGDDPDAHTPEETTAKRARVATVKRGPVSDEHGPINPGPDQDVPVDIPTGEANRIILTALGAGEYRATIGEGRHGYVKWAVRLGDGAPFTVTYMAPEKAAAETGLDDPSKYKGRLECWLEKTVQKSKIEGKPDQIWLRARNVVYLDSTAMDLPKPEGM